MYILLARRFIVKATSSNDSCAEQPCYIRAPCDVCIYGYARKTFDSTNFRDGRGAFDCRKVCSIIMLPAITVTACSLELVGRKISFDVSTIQTIVPVIMDSFFEFSDSQKKKHAAHVR